MRIAIDKNLGLYIWRSDLARLRWIQQMCAFKTGEPCSGFCPHLRLNEGKVTYLDLCQGSMVEVNEVKYLDEVPKYEDE